MASGVTINDECLLEYNKLKTKSMKTEGEKLRYFIMRLTKDKKNVEITKKVCRASPEANPKPEGDMGAGDAEFLQFRDFLKTIEDEKSCCFAVYDFPHTVREMCVETLVFISWCPDTSKITDKMVYNSSKAAVMKKLNASKDIQANDMDDLKYSDVLAKVAK